MKAFVIVFIFMAVRCSPLPKISDVGQNMDEDERHFPNGTVVGKCTYLDREGDPIHVKYYAHRGGYGVELQSVKVSKQAQNINQIAAKTNLFESLDNMDTTDGINVENRLNKKYIKLKDQGRRTNPKNAYTDEDSVGAKNRKFYDHNLVQRYGGNNDPDFEIFVANRPKHIPDNLDRKVPIRIKSKRLLHNVGWKCLRNNN